MKCIEINKTQTCQKFQGSICLTCKDGYFRNENNECEECLYSCSKCTINSTHCYECKSGFVLQNNDCISTFSLQSNCKQFLGMSTDKCAICKDGYYRHETICKQCISNCQICNQDYTCITCRNGYFRNKESTCSPISQLLNCTESTNEGCIKCQQGFYLRDYECFSCSNKTENCQLCNQDGGSCQSCKDNYVLTKEQTCIHYTKIQRCKQSFNSTCSKCDFWYAPSKDGLSCQEAPVTWVIVVACIVGVIILIIVVLIIIVLVYFILRAINKKTTEMEQRSLISYFKLKGSNIEWYDRKEIPQF